MSARSSVETPIGEDAAQVIRGGFFVAREYVVSSTPHCQRKGRPAVEGALDELLTARIEFPSQRVAAETRGNLSQHRKVDGQIVNRVVGVGRQPGADGLEVLGFGSPALPARAQARDLERAPDIGRSEGQRTFYFDDSAFGLAGVEACEHGHHEVGDALDRCDRAGAVDQFECMLGLGPNERAARFGDQRQGECRPVPRISKSAPVCTEL